MSVWDRAGRGPEIGQEVEDARRPSCGLLLQETPVGQQVGEVVQRLAPARCAGRRATTMGSASVVWRRPRRNAAQRSFPDRVLMW